MAEKRIAVVGAGVFGSWISLLAVRAGYETILIDQYGPANEWSSSAGSSRIIRRAYGADEIYTLFAQRALEWWTAFLAKENRTDCFRRTGVLWLANGGEASIHAARGIFERHKLSHEFLDVGGIRRLCPGMDVPDAAVALFEPDCGALAGGGVGRRGSGSCYPRWRAVCECQSGAAFKPRRIACSP